eukprot:826377-Amphidinium_carterae.1
MGDASEQLSAAVEERLGIRMKEMLKLEMSGKRGEVDLVREGTLALLLALHTAYSETSFQAEVQKLYAQHAGAGASIPA